LGKDGSKHRNKHSFWQSEITVIFKQEGRYLQFTWCTFLDPVNKL
jgi:hypothetical protein